MEDCLAVLSARGLVTGSRLLCAGVPASSLTYNSKEACDHTLFICKGARFSPAYLEEAARRGAVCYVSEQPYETSGEMSYILVGDIRKAMSALAAFFYQNAYEAFQLTGITGTKGKSTTAYFVKSILDEYAKGNHQPETAILSSIDTYDGVIRQGSVLTTPEAIDLHRHFDHAARTGLPYFTMEVSSQALKYDRVSDVRFDVGCFLNFGEDHISPLEHPDIEDYLQAKLKLFGQCQTACVNLGTDQRERVLAAAAEAPRLLTFGTYPQADIYGYGTVTDGAVTRFKVRCDRFDRAFAITMPGLFNVENALAAIAIGYALDIPERYMYLGLVKARASGRMEVYSSSDDRVIAIVDYAHNRISFEKLFQYVRQEYPDRDIVSVFGCPGAKARQRRRDLGEIAGRYSTRILLTEEDPGTESVLDISREVQSHIGDCPSRIIEDRGQAIEAAVMGAKRDSVILILGKGDEDYQKRASGQTPCVTDVEHTRASLKAYDIAHKLDLGEQIDIFLRLLPQLQVCRGQTMVIRASGAAIADVALEEALRGNIALLRMVGADVHSVETDANAFSAARALRADRLIFLDDAEGLLLDKRNPKTLLRRADADWVAELLDNGFAGDERLPNLRECVDAVRNGVKSIVLLDGRARHALLLGCLSEKAQGTGLFLCGQR